MHFQSCYFDHNYIKPIVFLTFSLPSVSLDLKVPSDAAGAALMNSLLLS